MTEKDLRIARALKERLLEADVPLVDLRVFGSRARGDADEDSDLDVMIEVEGLDRALKKKIRRIAWEVGLPDSLVVSTLICSRDEMERSAFRSAPIVKNISEEGVRI